MNRNLVLGAGLTAIFLLAALVSFAWVPQDVTQMDIANKIKPPSAAHPLGTDHFGRDILSMLMVGARTSIAVAIVAVGIGIVLGVPLGLLAAANRGSLVDEVVIDQLYVERRVVPLDLYVQRASPTHARSAVVDFGRSVKELAVNDIFPGDLLIKNFGVTRHGRVVFYDYDELTTLDECVFRRLPVASSYDDEMAAEPWFPGIPRPEAG